MVPFVKPFWSGRHFYSLHRDAWVRNVGVYDRYDAYNANTGPPLKFGSDMWKANRKYWSVNVNGGMKEGKSMDKIR